MFVAQIISANKTRLSMRLFSHFWLEAAALSCVLLLCAGLSRSAHASHNPTDTRPEPWPTRAVKLVVPFPPGGLGDTMARVLAPSISSAIDHPVVVENRPGGNAMIGYDAVAQAPADGYTWLSITLTHAINQTLIPGNRPALAGAFVPVALMARSPLVIVVHPRLAVTNLQELVKLAKTQKLAGGSSGNGTPPHLGLALLEDIVGADIIHVPYKGGAPSVNDLVAGQLDLIVSNLPESLAQIRAGKLRALAVTSTERTPLLPDVPTTREAGFGGLLIENWNGLLVPASTPAPIVARISREVGATLAQPELRTRLEAIGFAPTVLREREFAQFLNAEIARWGKLVTEKKIKTE